MNAPKCIKIFKSHDYPISSLTNKITLVDNYKLSQDTEIEILIKQKDINTFSVKPIGRYSVDWFKVRAVAGWAKNNILLNPVFLENNIIHFQHSHIFTFADLKINASGYHFRSSLFWVPFSYDLIPQQLPPVVIEPIPDYTDVEHNTQHFNVRGPGFNIEAFTDVVVKKPYMQRQVDFEMTAKSNIVGNNFFKWKITNQFKI